MFDKIFGRKKEENANITPIDDWKSVEYNFKKFSPDNWSAPDVDKNKEVQGLANQLAKEYGIDNRPVVLTNGSSLYDHDKDIIKIGKDELRLPEQAAFRIGHEMEHAFQKEAVEGKLSEVALKNAHVRYGGEDAFNKKVAEWRVNLRKGAYYDPINPDYEQNVPIKDEYGQRIFTLTEQKQGGYLGDIYYQSQPIEKSANLAGVQTAQRVKDDLSKSGKGVDTSGFEYLIEKENSVARCVERDELKVFGVDPEQTVLNKLTKRADEYSKKNPTEQKTIKGISSQKAIRLIKRLENNEGLVVKEKNGRIPMAESNVVPEPSKVPSSLTDGKSTDKKPDSNSKYSSPDVQTKMGELVGSHGTGAVDNFFATGIYDPALRTDLKNGANPIPIPPEPKPDPSTLPDKELINRIIKVQGEGDALKKQQAKTDDHKERAVLKAEINQNNRENEKLNAELTNRPNRKELIKMKQAAEIKVLNQEAKNKVKVPEKDHIPEK